MKVDQVLDNLLGALGLRRADLHADALARVRADLDADGPIAMTKDLARLLGEQVFLTGRPTIDRAELKSAGLSSQEYESERARIRLQDQIDDARDRATEMADDEDEDDPRALAARVSR